MTWPWHEASLYRSGEFAKARAKAEVDALAMRDRAARTVAQQAVDADDYRRLVSMLGLDRDDVADPATDRVGQRDQIRRRGPERPAAPWGPG